jgi:hypothetical protein
LRDGFDNSDSYEYFLLEENRIRNLIFTLLEDPDPDIERDRPPEDHAGHNDPSYNALNTVRPVALDSLTIYAMRKADDEGEELDSEIKSKLENKLDDLSLGFHSVFGRRFVTLWVVDQDWVVEHLSDIFPRSQSRQDKEKFTAAWDSYVAFNNAHKDIFPKLRSYYFHAIDLMAEGENTETVNVGQRMAGHLLANYLFEYDLEDWSDSLLAYLYERSDPDLARQVAWNLWKWGDSTDDEPFEKWDKTKLLWNRRLDQVGEDETFSEEISWFVRWLEHVENSVELDEVGGLLKDSLNHIAQNRRAWAALEEYLSAQSNNYTEVAVDIFHILSTRYERPMHHGFTEEAASILRPGLEEFENGDKAYDKAFEAAQTYDAEAQRFLDDHR